MRYFEPHLKFSSELPQQTAPADKLGGLPWGLAPEAWPVCSDCGKYQSLLAQFVHHPVRLNLGREGRVLHVFQCNHSPGLCSTWEGGSGANACFVTEPEELLNTLSVLPEDRPELDREAFIITWEERNDGIDPALESRFYSWATYSQFDDGKGIQVDLKTKLGSVPWWVQSPDDTPQGNWRFIGQLSDNYYFSERPSEVPIDMDEDYSPFDGRSYYRSTGPNFGGGIGYIFLRQTESKPEGWFFWQC